MTGKDVDTASVALTDKDTEIEAQVREYRKTKSVESSLTANGTIKIELDGVVAEGPFVEYLPDVDGFFTPFAAEGRTAKFLWILAGVGF